MTDKRWYVLHATQAMKKLLTASDQATKLGVKEHIEEISSVQNIVEVKEKKGNTEKISWLYTY